MTDHEPIATGLPMSLAQMQKFLQDYHGIPVVLREQGETGVKCPYCGEIHHHDHGPGHFVAGCSEKDRNNIGMVIGERYRTMDTFLWNTWLRKMLIN